MMGLFKQQSRLCVLESQFEQFQKSVTNYMEHSESSKNEIIKHIDAKHKSNTEAIKEMKDDLVDLLDRDYETKLESELKMTSMRDSIVRDLNRNVLTVIAVISAIIALCGWLYVNVGKHENHDTKTSFNSTLTNKPQDLEESKHVRIYNRARVLCIKPRKESQYM